MAMQMNAMMAEAEKVKMNARSALERDAPFALRGSLGRNSTDGFGRPLPSLEQLRGYKTQTRFPYASIPSKTAQPIISPNGNRSLHSSQMLSAPTKGAVSNRPLSPHLPLKKPQLSATYSISHRIFGAALGSAILLTPVVMKFSLLYDV
ncbi:succinate dehydrogenase subunit 3-2, mitochondrial-like [Typha angustifolia]|uniref:succinate dehydrogenase subunit 3-2, mitochondrial-like n=1 Tax=Typha angustifolia TaxID=59011 RepID=UPI003C2F0BAB